MGLGIPAHATPVVHDQDFAASVPATISDSPSPSRSGKARPTLRGRWGHANARPRRLQRQQGAFRPHDDIHRPIVIQIGAGGDGTASPRATSRSGRPSIVRSAGCPRGTGQDAAFQRRQAADIVAVGGGLPQRHTLGIEHQEHPVLRAHGDTAVIHRADDGKSRRRAGDGARPKGPCRLRGSATRRRARPARSRVCRRHPGPARLLP